jgi:lysophospholipase L1-like esterase
LDFYEIKTTGGVLVPSQILDSITINSLGFRGTEFSEIKPLDTYRIFMVGGSTMFGAGATADETTIPGFTQGFLNERDFGFDIEVINAGIQGADSDSELNLAEQKLRKFNPDLIIVYDGWNDLRANIPPNEIKKNWELMCELGKENDFDVIISLQPMAGFGNKVLTKQELEYAQNGQDYNKNPLTESFSTYQDYAESLQEIKACVKTIDLRGIFDAEPGPIYWDEAHVSDGGNSIVAKSLAAAIFPIISKNDELNIFGQKKSAESVSSLVYDGREIAVSVELLSSNDLENKKIKISTYDNTNHEYIQNVTYLLSISKNNENLLGEYFFTQDGVLVMDIQSNNESTIKVIGEKQYQHNAYVMQGFEYIPVMDGESLTSVTPIQITGPIFNTEGIYDFKMELLTLDSHDNWVFGLSGFHSQITIGKDVIWEDSTVKNQLP